MRRSSETLSLKGSLMAPRVLLKLPGKGGKRERKTEEEEGEGELKKKKAVDLSPWEYLRIRVP